MNISIIFTKNKLLFALIFPRRYGNIYDLMYTALHFYQQLRYYFLKGVFE